MGPTAKAGLICAMVALMLAGQLLEKEFAGKRKALALERKTAPQPYAELLEPLPPGKLPTPRPEPKPQPGVGGAPQPLPNTPSGEIVYVVQQNDTLSKIAKRLLGAEASADLIAERNKKVLPDPAKLQVGMTLHIPAKKKPAPR